MRKNAWVICCCTAVLAAFGTFFRWLQDQVCFEANTGLAVRGSIWPYAVALMIVIAAVVLAVVCFRMKNQPHTYFPDSLPAALAASPRVRTIGGIVLGALLAVGGLWLLLGSGTLASPGLQRVLAVLAIAAGAAFARDFAAKTGAVVAVTGAIDIVADAERAYAVRNGSPLMGRITGAGCMLSCVCAAFATANPDALLDATVAAVVGMGLAGQIAQGRMGGYDGNGSFRTYLLDALYNLDGDALEAGARVEELA